MRGAKPPLSHMCAVVVLHIVLEDGSSCYLSECTLSTSAFKYTRNTRRDFYRGADKSLARPGRKQATATKL